MPCPARSAQWSVLDRNLAQHGLIVGRRRDDKVGGDSTVGWASRPSPYAGPPTRPRQVRMLRAAKTNSSPSAMSVLTTSITWSMISARASTGSEGSSDANVCQGLST